MWTEMMETKDIEHFDRQLLADDPRTVSKGTPALMRLMGVGPMPAPAAPTQVPTGGGSS